MAANKTFTELTELTTVDKNNDWLAVVDVSDTTASPYGTTKKANVDQFIGDKGDAATVDVGTTTTGAEGTNASVVNSGTTSAAVFNFTIPRGNTGATGAAGADGSDGADGDSAYVYIAYASDASGTDFTTTFSATLDYIAIKTTTTEITTPQASDFTGLWKNYKGAQGIQGIQGETGLTGAAGADGTDGTDGVNAYVYIAYASDSSGTGFTTTFDANLDYVAIKTTTTEIVTPQASDFTGLWKNYKGATGPQGIQGIQGVAGTNGTDGLDITWKGAYDNGTGYVVNDAVFYSGSSYICKLASTGNLPTNTTYWDLMAQQGAAGAGSGDVSGPASATDNAIARFDLVTGKLIQNSLVTVDDSGSINIPAGQQYLVNGSPVSGYSDEQAQDAVGGILVDTATIDMTYTDATPEIKADVKAASLNTTHLASGVLDTDLSSVSASDDTLPSAKATKAYADTKVAGPGSSTANGIAVFDGATGKLLKDSDGTGYGPITVENGSISGDTSTGTSTATFNTLIGKGFGPLGELGVKTNDIAEYSLNAGVTVDGVLIKDGLVDGRDVSTDGSKLDGIEALADVTDATNVASAGAVMESDTTTASMNFVIDEDTMASNLATKVPTQQSVKAYVDGKAFTWKGAWATSTSYSVNDTVESNGSGYVCTSAHTSGSTTEPGVGASWTTVWDLFVEGTDKTMPTGDIVGTTDTQTLTNKTLTAPALTSPTMSGSWDGWISAGETWTYASATTFTISGDKTGKYQGGDKIKLTQTTDKYFYVIGVSYSSPNTTVTVTSGSFYSLINATIINPYFSKAENPQGFSAPFGYTPTYSAESGTYTSIRTLDSYFSINGKLVTWVCDFDGTCSGTPNYIQLTLPVKCQEVELVQPAFVNGVYGYVDFAETYVRLIKAGGNWNTGAYSKGAFSVSYLLK